MFTAREFWWSFVVVGGWLCLVIITWIDRETERLREERKSGRYARWWR